ncbi:MAG: NADH-quinone oxidoreductase subunit C [Planctomycetota bacterium]
MANDLLAQLEKRVPGSVAGSSLDALDPWIEVKAEHLIEVCRFLHDDSNLRFDMLNCITAVDYFEPDEKKAKKVDWEPHISMVYHLSSIQKKHTLVLKVTLERWKDGVAGQLPEVPSVASIWRTADWHEREVFDLSGIQFVGHPNLRRILCPEDWVGHPLRKDYEMPLEYHGVRGR